MNWKFCIKHKYELIITQESKYVINTLSETYIQRNIYECSKCGKIKVIYLDTFYTSYKSDNDIFNDDWTPRLYPKTYGGRGGFSVCLENKNYISGHFVNRLNESDENLGFNIINTVTKICKDNNQSIGHTIEQITQNLKNNNVYKK